MTYERGIKQKTKPSGTPSKAKPLGRWNTAFLPDTAQPKTMRTECVGVCVCSDSESASRANSFTFLHAPNTKKVTCLRQWNSAKSTTRSFGGTVRLTGPGPVWQTMVERKNEKKETPPASNQKGSWFLSSLSAVFSIYTRFFSPAIPPAGRYNLLPFTPCQRMTAFLCDAPPATGGSAPPPSAWQPEVAATRSLQSRPRDGARARDCDLLPRSVSADQDVICTAN